MIPVNLSSCENISYHDRVHQDLYQNPSFRTDFSTRALGTPRSLIRDVFDKAARIPGVISLALGEPSVTAPEHVVEAGTDAIRRGLTHYTDVLGIPEYRRAVSGYARRIKGLEADPETEIQATPGVRRTLTCFWVRMDD